MQIIHPDYQRLDLHASLSFPLANAPLEAIFSRLSKDISRFNKLDKYYPIGSGFESTGENTPIQMHKYTIPHEYKKYTFTGLAAYGIICVVLGRKNATEFTRGFSFLTINDEVEIVHTDFDMVIKEEKLEDIHYYNKYINILPSMAVGKKGGINVKIHNMAGKRIAAHTITYREHKLRITNIQYILMNFLANAYIHDGPIRTTYLELYKDLISLTTNPTHEFLLPTYKTYGAENISEANEISLNKIEIDMGVSGVNLFTMPAIVYHPKK